MIVGKMTSEGVAAKAAALGTPTALTGTDAGKYQFTITANDFGTLADGDILVIVSAAGANKAAVLPNGLSWRQIVVDSDNATYATVVVVTKGQVLADRIPAMPDFYKAAMPGITFEYELD
jgi:archaellum component FlaG (FlaF/FlaG flagellin family)